MLKNRNAFTLTELMITVVLLGVVAGFGIPSYNKAREKADEREIVHNFRMIREAVKNYRIRNNGHVPPRGDNVDEINTLLNLGIIASNQGYTCSHNDGPPEHYSCKVITTYGWDIYYSDDIPMTLRCDVGPCPSVDEMEEYTDDML